MTRTRIANARSFAAKKASAVIGLLLTCGLLLASHASASFEQVDNFADQPGTWQLYQPTGMAVNVNGVGGVPAGTLYAVTDRARVLRYSPKGEFREAWGWGVSPEGGEELQRCGPDGEASHPTCPPGEGAAGEKAGTPGEGVGQLANPKGIAVDQTTGNVYVLNGGRQHDVVQVFNADGSQVIAGFGEHTERAPFPETSKSINEDFGSTHSASAQSIAVDDSGNVYISDADYPNINPPATVRVMVFEPQSPGDYGHYVYAGASHDIASSLTFEPRRLAVDSSGNLYTSNSDKLYRFDPADPATPDCEYVIPRGGAGAMTVDPESGVVFYFSFKDLKIRQLSPCNSQGEFEQTSVITMTPKKENVETLAFSPALAYEVTRPAGILYAADGSEVAGGKGPREGGSAGLGYIFAPAEVHLPSVDSESLGAVGVSSARLGAQINPHGSSTRYSFQYITQAAYEANEPSDRFAGAGEAPVGSAALGTGQVALSAAVTLLGLEPDTTYHYRAVATSHCEPEDEAKVCEATGADQSFHTFAVEAVGLPDNRAYELISPAQKHGGEVFPLNPSVFSCELECKPGFIGDRFPMQSSPDGEAVVYQGFPFSFTEGAAKFNEYVSRRTPSGWQTTILSPLLQGGQGYQAFDPELTQGIIYQVSPTLSPEAPEGFANLYAQPTGSPATLSPLVLSEPLSRTSDFKLAFVGGSADFSRLFFEANDALSGETPFAREAVDGGAAKNNLYEWSGGELRLVNVAPGNTATAPGAAFGIGPQKSTDVADLSHAISTDGSRAFWSSESGQVYVRVNGESTIAIPDPGKYLTASADGSQVLLRNGHLVEVDTETVTDPTEGKGGFEGIVGQSDDLSSIYFVDTAVLSEAENDQHAKAQSGKPNLYAWNEGELGFVATLGNGDNSIGFGSGDWAASPAQRTAEASPNGRWLAFLSRVPLSGYDNVGPACDRVSGTGEPKTGPCVEVFLYDSATGKLSCPSCNPSNQRPLGPSNLALIYHPSAALPQPRYLTDSGRLYFDSGDSLTPFDTNNGVEDVYQYEPDGVGSCKREGGCVQLISAGHEPVDSNFLSADATGKNVFFTSRDQLVLKDRDDLLDLYVAREGGVVGAESEVARGECQGEACQSAISPPNDPTPGSSSFEGAGNVDEKKATKKHKKKHKHAKKAHHKKRAHKRAANNNRGGAK